MKNLCVGIEVIMQGERFRRATNSLYSLEFKLQRKSTFWWIGVLGVLMILELLLYPLVDMMMGTIPEDILEEMEQMGMSFEFPSVTAYFLMQGAQVLALGGGLFLCCYCANTIMRDFKGKQSELLYTNALSRQDIVLTKFASAVTMVVVFNVLMLAIELVCMCIIDINGISIVPILAMFLYSIILHLLLVTITFSIYLLKKKSGYGIAIAIPLLLYFFGAISYAVSLDVPFLMYLTPYTPFYEITAEAPFDVNFYSFIIYAVVAIALFVWGLLKFKKRDFA